MNAHLKKKRNISHQRYTKNPLRQATCVHPGDIFAAFYTSFRFLVLRASVTTVAAECPLGCSKTSARRTRERKVETKYRKCCFFNSNQSSVMAMLDFDVCESQKLPCKRRRRKKKKKNFALATCEDDLVEFKDIKRF